MYYDWYSNNIFNQSVIFKMWYNWFVVYKFYNNKHFIELVYLLKLNKIFCKQMLQGEKYEWYTTAKAQNEKGWNI